MVGSWMKQAIDFELGRALYGRRFATVEPVFGNLRHNKRLNRFTLRGQKKVDGQWKLYCRVGRYIPPELRNSVSVTIDCPRFYRVR